MSSTHPSACSGLSDDCSDTATSSGKDWPLNRLEDAVEHRQTFVSRMTCRLVILAARVAWPHCRDLAYVNSIHITSYYSPDIGLPARNRQMTEFAAGNQQCSNNVAKRSGEQDTSSCRLHMPGWQSSTRAQRTEQGYRNRPAKHCSHCGYSRFNRSQCWGGLLTSGHCFFVTHPCPDLVVILYPIARCNSSTT